MFVALIVPSAFDEMMERWLPTVNYELHDFLGRIHISTK